VKNLLSNLEIGTDIHRLHHQSGVCKVVILSGSNMAMNGRVLAISTETDSITVASLLKNAEADTSFNQISFHAVTIDQTIADAFVCLLRHGDRSWESVEIINCRGHVENAITLALSVDRVKSLSLVRNIEMAGGYAALGVGLQATTSLKQLRLTSNIHLSDATALTEGLRRNTTLEALEFRWSTLDEGTVSQLTRGLRENRHLKSLDFFGCSLEDEDLAEIASGIRYHPTIEVLSLNGNKCGVSASRQIATIIESDGCLLRKVDISFQRHDAESRLDVSVIAAALRSNKSLHILDLTCNRLNDQDAEVLAEALCDNTTLQELFLARNKITDSGIASIARDLPNMRGLKKLSLWGNTFGEDGATALLGGMARNMELHDLHLFRQFNCSDLIQYFTNINRGGRKLLQESPNVVPMALWPLVMERANNIKLTKLRGQKNEEARVDMLFCLLRGPVLFARGLDFASSNF
jgi:Ran GTPase-activating protein (RanGAP) involved in mRNA processing and transport